MKQYIEALEYIKKAGVPKDQALDYLDFDSDEYPDTEELKQALDEVYGV